MKYSLIILLILLLNTVVLSQQKMLTAVLELKGEGIDAGDARLISSRLRTHLFNTNKFTVVEREKMNEILSEQGFQMSGCTNDECAVEAGKLLGVKYIVAGDVGKIGNLYTISLRLIDVETGRLERVITEDCECQIEEFLQNTINTASDKIAGITNIKIKDSLQDYIYLAAFTGFGNTPLYNSETAFSAALAYGDSKIGRVGVSAAIIVDELFSINLCYAYPSHIYKKFSFIPQIGLGYLDLNYYYDEESDETGVATGLGSFLGGSAELELVSSFSLEITYIYGFSFSDLDASYDNISGGLSYKF